MNGQDTELFAGDLQTKRRRQLQNVRRRLRFAITELQEAMLRYTEEGKRSLCIGAQMQEFVIRWKNRKKKRLLYILDTTFTDGSGVELARHIRAFDPMPPLVFIRPKLSRRRFGKRWKQCEQNDRVLFATLVKRRIKMLNAQIE